MLLKSLKWCFGIALVMGLSACMDMMQRSQQMEDTHYRYPEQMHTQQKQQATTSDEHKPAAKQKTYASKDPTQRATPGPTRKAAPQLPVVQ